MNTHPEHEEMKLSFIEITKATFNIINANIYTHMHAHFTPHKPMKSSSEENTDFPHIDTQKRWSSVS